LTDERQFAALLFAVGLASAVVTTSLLGLAFAAMGLVSLLVGYRRKSSLSVAVTGLFLYYPLALGIGRVVSEGWSFVASSVILVLLAERLNFEYNLSKTLESPLGIDEESRNLAMSLSESHFVSLVLFVAASAGLAILSLAISNVVAYFPLLAGSSILLVFILWVYSRR
jgi:hypothetical protein